MMNIMSYIPDLISGLTITLILMLASISIGLVMAVIMTIGSYSRLYILKKLIASFIFLIRGTPLLVQIFIIYYGAGQFEWIRETSLWFILREPIACAIIALSFNTACYTTILLQGAIQSVPKNEIAACEAIGMSKWLAFRRVIFPRAFRLALPAYSNEILMVLKGTSLASTITLLDLMGITQRLIAETYETVSLYVMIGIVYLALNMIITAIFNIMIKRTTIPQLKS